MAVVAAPTYLARRGVPQTPYDLDAHNCIAFNFTRHVDECLSFDGTHVSLPARGDVVASDGEISRRLALAGQGVTRLSLSISDRTSRPDNLFRCWKPTDPGDVEEVNVVYVGHGGRLPARVRALIEFLAREVDLEDPLELLDTI